MYRFSPFTANSSATYPFLCVRVYKTWLDTYNDVFLLFWNHIRTIVPSFSHILISRWEMFFILFLGI